MLRTVFCAKLHKELPGLERIPYPGSLGKRIFEEVSQEAWQAWLKHQTLLINENRLNVLDPKARIFIEGEMQKYFFEEEGSATPAGFKPPSE
ncbi:MAG TPA: oxidative damage protection protein [Candidatus Berkiella sp.]|nr:oxidative damage protection protein [Candidatus Berkiella sp.]